MKFTVDCPTCAHSLKKGWLWLRGSDYVECPNCLGSGEMQMTEHRVKAKVQEIYVPRHDGGLSKRINIISPWRT